MIECKAGHYSIYFEGGFPGLFHDVYKGVLVKLHFASGNVIKVLNALDENLYPGQSVETLVDDCICRYFIEEG